MKKKDSVSLRPYPLGVYREREGLRIAYESETEDCGIVLYDRATGEELQREPFLPEERVGRIFCKYLKRKDWKNTAYLFYEGEQLKPDQNARAFAADWHFGQEREAAEFKAVLPDTDFAWQGDERPGLKLRDSLVYCLHVRGFTAHKSSGVRAAGCFGGIVEKLPYLKGLGITTLELQPAYEFTELPAQSEMHGARKPALNYWGYKRAFYYAPKSAYARSGDAVTEFKELVRSLHANGMELVMQFYFPPEVKVQEMQEVLRYWVLEYHVDGFHLLGGGLPAGVLAADAMLADTKLWYENADGEPGIMGTPAVNYGNLAVYRDDYMYVMRRFLKGDADMTGQVLYQMRHLPADCGKIHYLTNYGGFTLMDLVSYDRKHNEENGEENRDGNDYNCSWNCGEEGNSRKARVKALRQRQIKNAMCMLLFSQSTPLIFMGDEFGNSQRGNNNPYCQDNSTAWLDWRDGRKHAELTAFWRELVAFRREHPVLRPAKELRLTDYLACGYPDLSYHGENAWRPRTDYHSRTLGMMFCGKYERSEEQAESPFVYLAMNLHWEKHELALPRLPKGLCWKKAFTTEETMPQDGRALPGEKEQNGKPRPVCAAGKGNAAAEGQKGGAEAAEGDRCVLQPRSIAVYVSSAETPVRKRAQRKKAAGETSIKYYQGDRSPNAAEREDKSR